MTGLNQGRDKTVRYSADATGSVKKDDQGNLVEELTWSNLERDGTKVIDLKPGLVQKLCLIPQTPVVIPNLATADSRLIGPITDLLTFYVDLQLAAGLKGLKKRGDRVYFPHGTPSSWADGQVVLLGQDSIDFEISIKSIDRKRHYESILVRHVPPPTLHLALAADWMKTPIDKAPNNWVEVVKAPNGKYMASVGKETFDVEMKVSLDDGRILSAKEDNSIEVEERTCSDPELQHPGSAIRYRIFRHIEIESTNGLNP